MDHFFIVIIVLFWAIVYVLFEIGNQKMFTKQFFFSLKQENEDKKICKKTEK